MGARAAINLADPLFTNTTHRLDFYFYEDAAKRTPKGVTTDTIVIAVKDASASTVTYTATTFTATANTYKAYIQLTAASHTTAGEADIQCRVNGVTREYWKAEFVAKL